MVNRSLIAQKFVKEQPIFSFQQIREDSQQTKTVQITVIPCFFIFYLDMVLVEALDNRVSEELVVRSNALPLLSCPLHVLLPPSKAVVAVHKAQDHLNPMLPSLR
jgi:hypothetical protein